MPDTPTQRAAKLKAELEQFDRDLAATKTRMAEVIASYGRTSAKYDEIAKTYDEIAKKQANTIKLYDEAEANNKAASSTWGDLSTRTALGGAGWCAIGAFLIFAASKRR